MLATFPFLCRLSPASRALLEASGRTVVVEKGQSLVRSGERIRGVYLVLSGRLRVYTRSENGDEVALYSLATGETCPLAMNALLGAASTPEHIGWVDVETKNARLLFIPSACYRDLHENEKAVMEFTLRVLSGRIAELMRSMADLSLSTVGERVEKYLNKEAGENGEVLITHQELALAVGTAREVVSREIRRLRGSGVLNTGRGRIVLQGRASR